METPRVEKSYATLMALLAWVPVIGRLPIALVAWQVPQEKPYTEKVFGSCPSIRPTCWGWGSRPEGYAPNDGTGLRDGE